MVLKDPIDLPYCDHEPRSRQAWQKSGLHPEFIKPIMEVANIYNSVILIRRNDPNYIELLTARYATKSMYLHSKTCSWGPMTGFVCFDPTFHKKPTQDPVQRASQIRCFIESLTHAEPHHKLTKLSPLRITNERLRQLEKNKKIKTLRYNPGIHIIEANEPIEPGAAQAGYHKRKFELVREAEGLWAVRYLDAGLTPEQILQSCYGPDPSANFALKPHIETLSAWIRNKNFHDRAVLALIDPTCKYDENDFRSATTGDYDLFAMHPLLAHYAAGISLLSGNPNPHAMQVDQIPKERIPSWIRIPSSTKLYRGTSEADMLRRTRRTELLDPVTGKSLSPHPDKMGWGRTPLPSVQASMGSPAGSAPSGVGSPAGSAPSGGGYLSQGSPAGSAPAGVGAPHGVAQPEGYLSQGFLAQVASSTMHHSPAHARVPRFLTPPGSVVSAVPSMPIQGAMTARERDLISALNHRVMYGGSLHSVRLFHHGPDSHNPHGHSPDLPCIALLPCATHSNEERVAGCFRAIYISNQDQLADFYFWNIICAGYALSPGINLKWFAKEHPTPINIFNPDTESGTQAHLPHRQILENHIEFERNLNVQVQPLLREASNIWQGELIQPDPQGVARPLFH